MGRRRTASRRCPAGTTWSDSIAPAARCCGGRGLFPKLFQWGDGVTMLTQLLAPAQGRAIAKEAYIYGYPLVENYRVQHASFIDRNGPRYQAPWNQIRNTAHVPSPSDAAPYSDSDTLCSYLGLDLRAEPIVVSLPFVADGRYYSVQLSDAYTFNFAYLGSRPTGNAGGGSPAAGPQWRGETPHGINAVVHAETYFIYAIFRTQLKGPTDLENVGKIQ